MGNKPILVLALCPVTLVTACKERGADSGAAVAASAQEAFDPQAYSCLYGRPKSLAVLTASDMGDVKTQVEGLESGSQRIDYMLELETGDVEIRTKSTDPEKTGFILLFHRSESGRLELVKRANWEA